MDDRSSEGAFPAWLLWVIAPVTVLAAALIVLALVLGIQAGQRQMEAQRRQQVGIAIQRAMDYRTEGRLEEALAEYQRVLVLDPGNTAAVTGIENLLELASAGGRAGRPRPAGDPAGRNPAVRASECLSRLHRRRHPLRRLRRKTCGSRRATHIPAATGM